MGDIKNLNSTAVYAWTTLISVFICVPAALIMEGPRLRLAVDALANSHPNFYLDLFIVGLLYHLYNQVGHCVHDDSNHFPVALPADSCHAMHKLRVMPAEFEGSSGSAAQLVFQGH
jgi:Triose-phosphate Transporter family